MNTPMKITCAVIVAALSFSSAWAQDGNIDAMPGMDNGGDATKPMQDRSGMDHGSGTNKPMQDMSDMQQGGGMELGDAKAQGGAPPPGARSPDYSDGYARGPLKLGGEENFGSLLVDRLEGARTDGNTSAAYDAQAWYGRTYDRAVLKAEGDIDGGKLQDARSELLWGHAIASYWDTQLGARYDSGVGPDRGWLAFGVEGLAPYWFRVEATAYAGNEGRTAGRVAAEYELLFTQKLILQPRVEANIYGKRDEERELGSGLSDVTAGLRVRYEIRREFAPYVGIEWARKFGGTADFARAAGEKTSETRWIAGLRFWF